MKFLPHYLSLSLLCSAYATAEPMGIDQSLRFVISPAGAKSIRWYGRLGRTYFVMVSDPTNHLRAWRYAPTVKSGNDGELSYEVTSNANKGFFRLLYTDEPAPVPSLADFDNDGIPNWLEVQEIGSDPFNSASVGIDTDGDGMPDWWESRYGLNPNNPADASGYLVADGVTNLVKYKTGRNLLVIALTDNNGTLALKVHSPLE